jgi:hypothetical protein
MRRRQFIAGFGSAAAWPLVGRAQQAPRLRRIGILMPYPPSDTVWQSRVDALRQELQRMGWTRGANIEFDERWTTDNMDLVRANAANLVELKPDAMVGTGARVIPVLMQLTRLQKTAVRFHPRHRSGRRRNAPDQHRGGAANPAGQNRCRLHRLSQAISASNSWSRTVAAWAAISARRR